MEPKKALMDKREKLVLSPEGAVSTGSTLLNIACTGRSDCGFMKGAYYYLVGDSASGKTWISQSVFAEACANPAFKDYELIFDDVEGGALMDIGHYFGKEAAARVQAPEPSSTVESFYYRMRKLIKAGKPFIYVLDSQDALTSSAATKKLDKQQKASEEGEEAKGSYGDGKAKFHSENIRWVLAGIKKTKSILIIIGQTRDNIAMFSFEKKTRAGGKALRFYANIEIWTSVGKKLKKTVRGKPRTVGSQCIAEVKKNRVTGRIGKDRSVTIPIYYHYGIDDVGSCIDFLVAEKHWPKKDGAISAKELLLNGTRSELIQYIEKANLEKKLRVTVSQVWREIDKECEKDLLTRKKRYQ